MKPQDLVAWVVAVTGSILLVMGAVFLMIDWYHADFFRLRGLMDFEGGIRLPPSIQATLAVIVPAIVATFAVGIFRATRGELEFSALGVRAKGPAGPILLWVVCFLAVSAVLLAILKT